MFMRVAAAASIFTAVALVQPASAELVITIDKSSQRMTVSVDGAERHVWPVSTGRAGFGTPNGRFRPQWLARRHFSRKYYNSPMPHSIFFHGGYAIHGTNYISRLGGPASHGCVRLHPGNAATLFALVNQHGKANTRIVVTGSGGVQVARRSRARVRAERSHEPREIRGMTRPAVYDVGEPVFRPAPRPFFLFGGPGYF